MGTGFCFVVLVCLVGGRREVERVRVRVFIVTGWLSMFGLLGSVDRVRGRVFVVTD